MKKLFFLLLLLSSELSAQRWTPVMLNDTFHYRKNSANAVAGSFYNTSFSQNSGDTLFQINRIGCTYCVTIQGGPAPCDTCYGLRNLPNLIAGYSINKTASGTCYFNSNDTALLETNAAVGHSWVFLPSLSITAQVISADTLTIFNQPDSVKTALLSNGDTVKWTAQHGILQWPAGWGTGSYYRLAGIQNRNQGYQLPELFDYYDFQPGDVLQYDVADYNPVSGLGTMGISKWVFNQRTNYADSIVYSGIRMIFASSSGPVYTYQIPFSFKVTKCADHHTSMTADTWTDPLSIETMNYSTTHLLGCLDTSVAWPVGYIKSNYIFYSSGLDGIEIGNDRYNFPGLWLNMPGNQDTLSGYVIDYNDLNASQYRMVYAKYLRGLGLVKHSFEEPFVNSHREELTAYVKNGDTTGVIHPDSFFQLGIADQTQLSFYCFPNPANELLRIELAETSGSAQIELINLQGELVQRVSTAQAVSTISTSELAAGMYLLRVQTADGVSVQRVVIQH
jgi:hypothetical protein